MAQPKGLYIRAGKPRRTGPALKTGRALGTRLPEEPAPATRKQRRAFHATKQFLVAHPAVATVSLAIITAAVSVLGYELLTPSPPTYTQQDIAQAVEFALNERQPDPPASRLAYEAIAPSVVRVARFGSDPVITQEEGVGTGVIVEAGGAILTNYHVVAGAERVGIVFADGFETEAEILSVQPENDLAVLQAIVVPEGLIPATLAGTGDLRPGDEVIAVGHPFGIGPSVSAGVVSGLSRRYFSRGGEAILDNLIQFDAAANPGNSGGPLVNRRGEVVGIVTSILNPTEQAFFIGIGFAVPIETAANAVGPNPF